MLGAAGMLRGGGGIRICMATGQTKKKAARKTPQTGKTVQKEGKAGAKKAKAASGTGRKASQRQEQGAGQSKAASRSKARKLDRKKLSAMVDKMLLQLAEQVEEGECKITTSEGMKLIQLRETLGLDRPSAVKVEWVEPKAE
jgi:hypothetical protein